MTWAMLMKIAQNKVLANANHGSVLPCSWRTCYELTKLPAPILEAAISDGTVRSDMTRREVIQLQRINNGLPVVSEVAESPDAEAEPGPVRRAARHAVHYRTARRKPNREVERAINILGGVCVGFESLDVQALDPSKAKEWVKELRQVTSSLRRFTTRVEQLSARKIEGELSSRMDSPRAPEDSAA